MVLHLGDDPDELVGVGDDGRVEEEEVCDGLGVEEEVEELVLLDELDPGLVEIFDEFSGGLESLIQLLDGLDIPVSYDGSKSDGMLDNIVLVGSDCSIVLVLESRVGREVEVYPVAEDGPSGLDFDFEEVDGVGVGLGIGIGELLGRYFLKPESEVRLGDISEGDEGVVEVNLESDETHILVEELN